MDQKLQCYKNNKTLQDVLLVENNPLHGCKRNPALYLAHSTMPSLIIFLEQTLSAAEFTEVFIKLIQKYSLYTQTCTYIEIPSDTNP